MDLRYLKFFVAVAEDLNFTKAAERMHTVQPSLSEQIRRLEGLVGAPLFHRSKRRVALTDAGHVFLEDSLRILEEVETACTRARQVARAESGALNIGFIPGAEMKVFPRILPVLREVIPDLTLSLKSLTSPQQVAALCNHEINLGFLRGPIAFPELISTMVIRDEIVVMLPANHELAALKRIPPARLAGCNFIGIAAEIAPMLHDLTLAILERAYVHCHLVLSSENVLTSFSGVKAGVGFALLPDYIEAILPPDLVVRPLDMPKPPTIDLLVAYRKDDHLPAMTFVLNLLQERNLGTPVGPKSLRKHK